MTLPLWQCHKQVRADKIVGLERGNENLDVVLARLEHGELHFVPKHALEKHESELVGGYLVMYPDGYVSWSPAQAFEEGYTQIPE